MNGKTTRSPAHARRTLLLLAAVAALPVVLAYVLYFSGWRPQTTGNYGELVQPPRPLPELLLQTLDGKPQRTTELRGKWSLLVFAAADCLRPCQTNLDKMQRVILAQGKDAERVRPVLVVTDTRARDWLHYAILDYPGTLVLTGSDAAIRQLAASFELPQGSPLGGLNRIYVVDPLGNFMMSYPADADPSHLRKDLARLLRVSQVG